MNAPRIIIEVRGGVVVAVYSSVPDTSVSVLDHDELADGDQDVAARHNRLAYEVQNGGLKEVY